jgi:hypothetical protein
MELCEHYRLTTHCEWEHKDISVASLTFSYTYNVPDIDSYGTIEYRTNMGNTVIKRSRKEF